MSHPKPSSLIGQLRRLWRHMAPRRRKQFGLLLILMVLATFAEILSIGAVLPFLGVLTAPERVFHHPQLQPFVQWLGLRKPEDLLAPLTLCFGVAALMAGLMRLLLLWGSTRLTFATGADLSISIYRRTLHQPYAVHVARNSSEVINGIVGKVQTVIYNAINPVVTMIASTIMLAVILLALLVLDPVIALAAFGGFGAIYAVIIRLSRQRLKANAQRISHHSTLLIKSLQEGLGGIRDVLIDGSQDTYCDAYRQSDLQLRRAQGSNQFLSQSPRYVMEALGMGLIAILAFVMARQFDGIGKAIPVLGALALGAQRLLPVLQQLYSGWSSIQGSQKSLQDALALLEQPLPDDVHQQPSRALPFQRTIRLNQVSFRYAPQMPWVLEGIELTLPKGARVGFIGSTGSGKSTLLDIVMGLLAPTRGQLQVDDACVDAVNQRAWQAHIAHVPQTIFLSDATIEENIAFGVPKEAIDPARVRLAARQAQIAGTIEAWEHQYQTVVGERGVRLSGGQRQRIGIARALYKQADVIILDEATSALDNDTESSVMQAIEALGPELTILIIAHRLTTLKNCTHIVELSAGGISRVGSYRSLIDGVAAAYPQAQP